MARNEARGRVGLQLSREGDQVVEMWRWGRSCRGLYPLRQQAAGVHSCAPDNAWDNQSAGLAFLWIPKHAKLAVRDVSEREVHLPTENCRGG